MERLLVIFDDTCRICTGSVRFVRAFDWLQRFRYQGVVDASNHYAEVAAGDLDAGVRVRFPDGSLTVGVDAVRSIAMRTPLGVLLAWLLYVPIVHGLAARAYAWVARHRHASCSLEDRRRAEAARVAAKRDRAT